MCTGHENCDCDEGSLKLCDTRLPDDPFTAIQFHYGMLLGVDDLETTQSYPRGKMRLHNAWLHRDGVVWGLGVDFDEQDHLRVRPGLALDAAGHELHLDHEMCLDLVEWYGKHKGETDNFKFDIRRDGSVHFDANVVVSFRACLSRQVPALRDPCGGASTDTAYSRAMETVSLLLRPVGGEVAKRPYPRLRVLFGLPQGDEGDYPDVVNRRVQIMGRPTAEQPLAYLEAFREYAALDEIGLGPKSGPNGERLSRYPEDPTELLLARVADITLVPEGTTWRLAAQPAIDVGVRHSHVSTSTIQELLCGPLLSASGGGGGAVEPAPGPGPRIIGSELQAQAVRFKTSEPLAPGCLDESAFSVTFWSGADGWLTAEVREVESLADGVSYRVLLKEKPAGDPVRFIARGTGPAPLVSEADTRPLGSPGAAGAADGTDYVAMLKRSTP